MTNVAAFYAPTFKTWQVKQLGPKPGNDLLELAHKFGRPGKQSLALAMAMRAEGVTAGQIQIACGAPQNNHRRGLIGEGMFKRNAVAPTDAGHTVYQITLTARGKAAADKAARAVETSTVDGDAKPAKKATSKPRKPAKAKAVEAAPPVEAPADQPSA